jgi:superfamily II DNA helicase RecQ
MVQYCEDFQDCRRVQQLSYFGEDFSAQDCNSGCDVCLKGVVYEKHDLTKEAVAMAAIVQVGCGEPRQWRHGRTHTTTHTSCRCPAAPQGYRSGLFTLLHTVDVFRGMKTKRIAASGKSWRGVLCWPLKFCQPSLASCCRTRSDGQLWGWKACEQT